MIDVALHISNDVARAGLGAILASDDSLSVVGEARSLSDAASLARAASPAVLLTEAAPSCDPAAFRRLHDAGPATRLIVFADDRSPDHMTAAMDAGASGFVVSDATARELVHAVYTVGTGIPYFDPLLAAELLRRRRRTGAVHGAGGRLSRREEEVFRLMVLGYKSGEMARDLGVSVRTIESHRLHIHQKLGRMDRSEMLQLAQASGLLGLHVVPSAASLMDGRVAVTR